MERQGAQIATRRPRLPAVLGALALVASGTACTQGSHSSARHEVLEALTEEVLLPSYRVVADRAAALAGDVRDACDEPANDDAFRRARGAWSLLRGAWVETAAFRFGPATTDRTLSVIDLPLGDTEELDALLTSTRVVPATTISSLGPEQRSMRAIEYVLHRDDQLSLRECDYLEAATTLLANGAMRVYIVWAEKTESGRPFADQVVHPGPDGAYATEDEVYRDLVNGMIAAIGDVTAQIGMISGDTTGTVSLRTADPGLAQRGRRDAIDTVTGVRRVFRGGPDGGIRHTESLSKETATQLADELDDAVDAIKELPQPFAIATQRAPAHEAYVALQAVQARLQAMAAELGVTITVPFRPVAD